jgi:hypothetical protein
MDLKPTETETEQQEQPPRRLTSELLARLDARRQENERLGIDQTDSTEILREIREKHAR